MVANANIPTANRVTHTPENVARFDCVLEGKS